MLVFSKANLVLLSVPKTGTTAYLEALAPLASMIVSAPPELKHAPVFRYNRFFRPMLEKFIGENLDVVAVMREPVSWLGSWYRYRHRPFMKGHENATHDLSFDEFVLAYMRGKPPGFANVGSQAKFLEPAGNGTRATHLFRYEDQPAYVAFLEQRLETKITTETRNASLKMQLDLSPEVEARFRRKCAHEFALWDSIGPDGAYTPPAAARQSR